MVTVRWDIVREHLDEAEFLVDRWRMASDAAMKVSTCRDFHRENELRAMWKSTRRVAMSGGRWQAALTRGRHRSCGQRFGRDQ